MKIALIRQKYTPFGGAERYMARLVEGLVAKGHEVHVLAAKWDSGGDPACHLPPGSDSEVYRLAEGLDVSLNCQKIIAREHFDIIFSLERTLRQDIYRAGDGCHRQWLRQKNLGKGRLRRMLTYLSPVQLAYLFLEKKLFTDSRLKAIIANSQTGKSDIVNLYGVSAEKISVIYNGIAPDAFPVGEKEHYRRQLSDQYGLGDELRILYVGSGFKRKGVPALLEAAALLDFPFKLFVVGKGRPGSYNRAVKRLGLAGRVVFTGPVRDVERFYLGCDLFVFPTLYDPFSNATLEAMACGLPIITSRFNGVAELIIDGCNGLVLRDPLDAEEIARLIKRIVPGEVRRSMGAQAMQTAGKLTMDRNTHLTLEVIEMVLKMRETAGE